MCFEISSPNQFFYKVATLTWAVCWNSTKQAQQIAEDSKTVDPRIDENSCGEIPATLVYTSTNAFLLLLMLGEKKLRINLSSVPVFAQT